MKNIFKKTIQEIKPFKKKIIIDPHKHWMYVLKIFFAAIIVLIIFSIYLLFEIKDENVFYPNNTLQRTQSLLKENLLKEITDYFDLKAINSQNIRNNPIEFPSLDF